METNFFQQLYDLMENVDLKMYIRRWEKDKLIISVQPCNEQLRDNAKNLIQPMNLKGTAKELDAEFFTTIQSPLKETASLLTNMENYLKALDLARKQSQMEKENREKEEKAKAERNKKYEAVMQKVADLESKEKWGEAIGAMPNASAFPEQSEAIQKKMDELRRKHGQLSLL